jgi:lysophospholipase L1-like esterase
MMRRFLFIAFMCLIFAKAIAQESVSKSSYLANIKAEMQVEWPKNRTINLVFHGHSVPAGYFKTPIVNTLEAYPHLVLKGIKSIYPLAVVNVINTSIGGEHSEKGLLRFESEVLVHRPDVLFIDYALNDRVVGLERAKVAWEKMIQMALAKNIKVILLTPSPDQRVNIMDDSTVLDQHADQIKQLALKHQVGIIDSYALFKKHAKDGRPLVELMSQVNHPNEKGHALIKDAILEYFQ